MFNEREGENWDSSWALTNEWNSKGNEGLVDSRKGKERPEHLFYIHEIAGGRPTNQVLVWW